MKELMSITTRTHANPAVHDELVEQCETTPITQWPENLLAVFADRLDDAFSQERNTALLVVEDQLNALVDLVLSNLPEQSRKAILDVNGDPAVKAAYLLGQLSFAQQFASTVAQRRTADAFFEEFENEYTKKIVHELSIEPSTKSQISAVAGLAGATVERKMKELLALGIVEFNMRYGADKAGVAEYYLTPAALAALK